MTNFDGGAPMTEPARPARTWKGSADLVIGSVVLSCLAPLVLRYSPPRQAGWDEAYFLGRTVCVSRAVSALDAKALATCFELVDRSPLIAIAAVPFGPLAASPSGLGLIPVSLGLLEWLLAVALVVLLLGLRAPPWMPIGVAAALALARLLADQAGRLLADVPFTLTVALALILVPLEARAAPRGGARADALRGLWWGTVFGLGLLGKMTFLVFAGVVGPTVVFLRWRALGPRSLVRTLGVAALAALPAIGLTALCWKNLYAHAQHSAFGSYAQHWSLGLGPLRYLATLAASAPVLAGVTGLLAAAFPLALRSPSRRRAALASLPPIVAVLLYEALALSSANQDVRFQLPTLVGLPLALVVPWARLDDATATVPARYVLAWLMVGALLVLPLSARYDFRNIVDQARFFDALPSSQKWRVLLATDSPTLDTDTLQAALELLPRGSSRAGIDTVVYDEADGRDLAFSLGKVALADYMILESDPARLSPEWTNRHAHAFREAARTKGRYVPELSTRDFEVYAMRGSR